MTPCETTRTPELSEIDIPALRERYRRERDKRLRKEGQSQYLEPVGDVRERLRIRSAYAGKASCCAVDRYRRRHSGRGLLRHAGRHRNEEGRCHKFQEYRLGRRLGWLLVLESLSGHPVRQRCLLLYAAARRNRLHAEEEVRGRLGHLSAQRAHREAFRPLSARDLSHAGHCAALGREDQSLAADHESRRRHSRSLRRHGRRSVEQAEVARYSGHEYLQGKDLPHRALGV